MKTLIEATDQRDGISKSTIMHVDQMEEVKEMVIQLMLKSSKKQRISLEKLMRS